MNQNRRSCLKLASSGLLSVAGAGCLATGAEIGPAANVRTESGRLLSRPGRIIKAIDLPREGVQTWFVNLLVEMDAPAIAPVETLECEYRSGAQVVRTERHSATALAPITFRFPPEVARTAAGGRAGRDVYRLLGIRLICRGHSASNIDRMTCRLHLNDGSAMSCDIMLDEGYEQRSDLIFPFRGPGLITQAGAANGGHRNGSGLFALDALGLAPNYGPQVSTASETPQDYAGFGRPLIAPAAGVIVFVRGDRPDQPRPGEVDDAYLLAEDPAGDPGNHIIVDHENGEFSMIAHLQAGSLQVAAGERVQQAQPVGRLGNSGNSFGPHVHYQLQDGPDRNTATGLPCRFSNISVERLDRGAFFTAE